MASPKIQFKRGGAGIAGTVPALHPGEPAFSTNNFDFFIGFDTSVSGNKFFGSHRYWTRENGSRSVGLNLVDAAGSNYIQLKSPDSVSGIGTYILPDTNTITDGYFLKVATNGTLSWDTAGGTNGLFTNPTLQGITTVTSNGGDALLDVNVLADFSAGANFTNAGVTTIATADINGGNIDGTVIGAATSAAGTFTDLVGTAATFTNLTINGSSQITDIDEDLTTVSASHDTLASALAIKNYVDSQVTAQDLDFSGDSGTGAVDLDSQSLTISGTANEIETVGAGTTLTIGLPNIVAITTSLTVGAAVTINSSGVNAGVNSITAQNFYGTLKSSYLDIGNSGLSTLTALADQDDFVVYDLDEGTNKLISAEYIGKYVSDRVNGDVTVDGLTGEATISNNAVGLGTQTTGQYAKTVVGGEGLSATTANSDDATDYTIDVNVGTGITITSDAVTLKGAASLTDNTVPFWDDTNGQLSDSIISTATVGGATTITIGGHLNVTGDFNGVITAAGRANTVDTTGTTTDATYFMLFADTSAGEQGETVRVSAAASLNPSGTGTFSVGTIQAGSIKSATGSNAITVNNSGTVETASDLTIGGNLIVNGTTTQVNTSEITVEDRTIELGVVNGALPSDTTWDLGILMNYGDAGVGKTSAVIWEASSSRFVLASNLTEAVGVSTDLPQITPSGYAALEIGSLWLNDCAGESQVISCTGSERFLENITVDGGSF
jgi:hypothetical protein